MNFIKRYLQDLYNTVEANKKRNLDNPFPVEKIKFLNFGSADGSKDELIEKAFIRTASIQSFLLNKHSIISGPIGSGKSALFRLLKESTIKNKYYPSYLSVPIEEAISFKSLKNLIKTYFPSLDEKIVYQLIWKFHIISRLAEVISLNPNFPSSQDETEINDFMKKIGSKGAYHSIIDKIRSLIQNYSLKIKTSILHFPINAEFSLPKKDQEIEINLDRILENCRKSLQARKINALILIDKIDKFIAGEEYRTQKDYIEALLDVEDDLSNIEEICFKIFIRTDLFERLDFTGLGYDKILDNTLKLEWSDDEIVNFLASRIYHALNQEKIIDLKDIFLTSDFSEYHLTGNIFFKLSPSLFPSSLYDSIFDKSSNKERTISLIAHLHKVTVTKIFPRKIQHFDKNGKSEEIDIFSFLKTHFKDGNSNTTPRHILIFLKEVQNISSKYYSDNPDQSALSKTIDRNKEWELFKKGCVYQAYKLSRGKYIKNIGKIYDEWSSYFNILLSKQGNKTRFEYKWFKSIMPDAKDTNLIAFMSFLHAVGYLKMVEIHHDIRKRIYELPTIYIHHND